jgi:hypothetical protein
VDPSPDLRQIARDGLPFLLEPTLLKKGKSQVYTRVAKSVRIDNEVKERVFGFCLLTSDVAQVSA